jgi:hypothetical protein
MTSEEMEFIRLKVKLLFRRLEEGKVKLVAENIPNAMEALKAVRFDSAGDPVYETITGPVRSMANLIYSLEVQKIDKELEERERDSPVHELLGPAVKVDDEVIQHCREKDDFDVLAFDLYRETAIVLSVSTHASPVENGVLTRNQAICAGLLVRIVKFMTAVMQLSASTNRGEVVMTLNRSIHESELNLRFLLLKNEARFYDQFVNFSLGPEREMYDIIQRNIAKRTGKILPIEQRMLESIDRVCKASGVEITNVDPKFRDWGGPVRNRLIALGEEDLYATHRIGSHAVHGTWVDLLFHNLKESNGGFEVVAEHSPVDSRLMLPLCEKLLQATEQYIEFFFPDMPELKPLLRRIGDLRERAEKVDRAAEEWLVKKRAAKAAPSMGNI